MDQANLSSIWANDIWSIAASLQYSPAEVQPQIIIVEEVNTHS